AVAGAAEWVATAVQTVMGTLAEVFSFIIGYVGSLLAAFSDAIGELVGGIPGIGGFLKGVFHWLGTVASAVLDFFATFVKATMNATADIGAGLIRVGVGGLVGWEQGVLLKGFADIGAGLTGPFIAILAKGAASFQAAAFMQMGERELTLEEKELLGRVYRSSVNLELVRVVDGFVGLFSVNSSAFTLGNKIYMKDRVPGSPGYRSTLVHECCHVWQSQHVGFRYLSEALWAQGTMKSDTSSAYKWEDESTRGNYRWQDFNKEAQAQFIQDVFSGGFLSTPSANADGTFFDDEPIGSNAIFGDLASTEFARESIAYIRS